MVYLSDYLARAEERMAKNEPVLLYGFEPDPFVAKHSLDRVAFPEFFSGCRDAFNSSSVHDGELACDFSR